jgi:hypothetical protein
MQGNETTPETVPSTSSSRSTSDGRRMMILPVAKRPGPGTDIPLCSVPLSLTWSLTRVSWPTPARPLVGANLGPERSGSRAERSGILRTPKAPLTHGLEVGDWSGEGTRRPRNGTVN